mmetsp:Transcript_19369/g.37990  ORF Transcript_19369/g.37990 Transcript_19369/m.37990 type:complete len:176 (-) Transcript_19369:185-712(-)
MVVSVKRVSVLNAFSHACLYDHIRQWSGERNTEALTGLIRSFFQFGAELGEGRLSKVKFSATEVKPNRHNRSRSRTGPVLGGARKVNTRSEEVYLHCYQGVHALVTAFTQQRAGEDDPERIRHFLERVDEAYGLHQGDSTKLEMAIGRAIAENFDTPSPMTGDSTASVRVSIANT